MVAYQQYVIFEGSLDALNIVLRNMGLLDEYNVLNVEFIDNNKYGIFYQHKEDK